jgi:hypothetical protein
MGDRVAYIAKNDEGYMVYVSEIDRARSPECIIRDNGHIEDAEFIDNNNLVYMFRDSKRNVRLMAVNLRTKDRRPINMNVEADNISIIKGGCLAEFVAVATVKEKFVSYRINVNTLSCEKLKEYPVPPVILLGGDLEPQLCYDNFSGGGGYGASVYVRSQDNHSGEQNKMAQIDTIQDIRTQKYVSMDDSCYYKLTEDRDQIIFSSQNFKTSETNESVVANSPGARLEDCKVNMDGNRKPLFVTINTGRKINKPLFRSAVEHLDLLDQKFPHSDWERVDASQDGAIWLIRVTNPQRPDRYFAYDTEERTLKEVAVSSKNMENIPLQKTEHFRIPISGGHDQDKGSQNQSDAGIRVLLTKSPNHNSRRPLMVMVESDVGKQSEWAFDPHIQLLVNRGCSVLVVRCRVPRSCQPKDVADCEVDDILDAAEWCIKHKICMAGNVGIYARGLNCAPALIAFQEKQNIFSVCILQTEGDFGRNGILSYVHNPGALANPLLIIGQSMDAKDDDKQLSSAAFKNIPLSYITYENNPSAIENSSLLELFLSKFHNIRFEKISTADLRPFRTLKDGNGILENFGGNNRRGNDDGRSRRRFTSEARVRRR